MSSPVSDNEPPSYSRQRRGLACEECRRRKLRCDGEHPCGVCVDTDVACYVNTARRARGQRKGNLSSLRRKVAELEDRLHGPRAKSGDIQTELKNFTEKQDINEVLTSQEQFRVPRVSPSSLEHPSLDGESLQQPPDAPDSWMSDLVREDLDQLYFERVHTFTPFLHQRRYFAYAKQPPVGQSRVSLQLAMWNLAASFSAQYRHLQDKLYRDTRHILESLELNDKNMEFVDLEQVQAWVLLSFYEFMCMYYRRGWMSLGRSFRLLQLMGLYKMDGADQIVNRYGTEATVDWIETEKRRRTFWMAYCLDRLVSLHNGCALTFNEQVICTRLPSSESDFESGESSILGGFLSEAMAISDHTVLTPFTENIVLATICGRTLSHRHQTAVERAYGDLSQDCWARHSWLHGILAARVRALSHSCSPISDPINPLVPFTALVAHATVLTLYDIAQALPCTPDTLHLGTLSAYESYAISAAYEIASLAEMFRQSSSFKASVPSD